MPLMNRRIVTDALHPKPIYPNKFLQTDFNILVFTSTRCFVTFRNDDVTKCVTFCSVDQAGNNYTWDVLPRGVLTFMTYRSGMYRNIMCSSHRTLRSCIHVLVFTLELVASFPSFRSSPPRSSSAIFCTHNIASLKVHKHEIILNFFGLNQIFICPP
jgi:hypothetical protein